MIIWILSKLFSEETLASAAAMRPGVLGCHLTTEAEMNDMQRVFEQCAHLVRQQVPRYSSEVDENVVH